MKKFLLLILLLPTTLKASDGKPTTYNLKIVDRGAFYYADDFWKTPAGIAFWETPEGKAVLKIMLQYREKMTSK